MFEAEISYHEYLFSGSALHIGKIHRFLLIANAKIERKIRKHGTETVKGNNIKLSSRELTDIKEVNHDIIHWWVFTKESDIETLLEKTNSVCEAVKNIRNSPLLSEKIDYESYESIILSIKDFTENNASEINVLYNYVSWLDNKNSLAPSILFTRKVWRSPRLKYERQRIISDSIDQDCIEFALGLRDEPHDYTLFNIYYEIDYEAYERDPEYHEQHPTPSNHRDIVPRTSIQVIKYIREYFKLIYNSLESIIEKIEEYNKTPVITTPQSIVVSARSKNIARVATAQINFELSNGFPPEIENQQSTKKKIKKAIEESILKNADIICLPELSVCESWVSEVQELCKDRIVIAGVNYDDQNHNVCKLISDFNEPVIDYFKITPSDLEEGDEVQSRMIPGKKLFIYQTKFGNLSILICRDFLDLRHHLDKNVDLLFVPSFNSATARFHEEAHSHVQNYNSYVVISNATKYGGSSIFGTVKNTYLQLLKDMGCKEKDDESYKLCELKKGEEGIIIADFNLDYKAVQVPALSHPSSVEKPVQNIEKILF